MVIITPSSIALLRLDELKLSTGFSRGPLPLGTGVVLALRTNLKNMFAANEELRQLICFIEKKDIAGIEEIIYSEFTTSEIPFDFILFSGLITEIAVTSRVIITIKTICTKGNSQITLKFDR